MTVVTFTPENRFTLRALTDVFQIKLNETLRDRAHELFYASLGPLGTLVLGKKESLRYTRFAVKYRELHEGLQIYRRLFKFNEPFVKAFLTILGNHRRDGKLPDMHAFFFCRFHQTVFYFFTDHMFTVEWTPEAGWHDARITTPGWRAIWRTPSR